MKSNQRQLELQEGYKVPSLLFLFMVLHLSEEAINVLKLLPFCVIFISYTFFLFVWRGTCPLFLLWLGVQPQKEDPVAAIIWREPEFGCGIILMQWDCFGRGSIRAIDDKG